MNRPLPLKRGVRVAYVGRTTTLRGRIGVFRRYDRAGWAIVAFNGIGEARCAIVNLAPAQEG